MSESDWIDQNEAARLLDRSPRTLETWRLNGRGPAYRNINGVKVRYLRADVIRFRDEQWKVTPTAPPPKYQASPKANAA